MNRKNIFFITCYMAALLSISCVEPKNSTLQLRSDENSLLLTALNAGAENAFIQNPEKSPYMYFAFPSDFAPKQKDALEITVQTSHKAQFAFGFLFENDFSSKFRLKKNLSERAMVTGFIQPDTGTSVSVTLPIAARGFFVYSLSPLSIESVQMRESAYGWKRGATSVWFGFSDSGGELTEETAAAFSAEQELLFAERGANIRVTVVPDEKAQNRNPSKIALAVGMNTIEILRTSQQSSILFDTRQFEKKDFKTLITSGGEFVWGIVLESAEITSKIEPIPADPGLILNWNRANWRNLDFEVFRWQQIPSVLFFDTANYAIQDSFFKRLAFFVEKSGYKGRLVTDKEVAAKHAYNAHDYRAADLARFFETARRENFPLNQNEQLLCQILLDNGIIRNSDGFYAEGEGAVVSISRESAGYLRHTFMAHEGLHALYFIDTEFRKTVTDAYNTTDEKSLLFLLRYFSVTTTLNYDLKDTYLIHNEFMGYVMQQPVARVADYFTKNIATRPGIVYAEPALVAYIIETNAQAFTDAAKKLDRYVFSRWGYNAGRVSLVTRR